MIADYLAGDCHTGFALRAALITAETDEEEQALIRNKQAKPVVLGSNYGMSAYGIRGRRSARSIGRGTCIASITKSTACFISGWTMLSLKRASIGA